MQNISILGSLRNNFWAKDFSTKGLFGRWSQGALVGDKEGKETKQECFIG